MAIKGPERCRRVMEEGGLTASFPWTPPTTLLGKSCLPFLEQEDADQLKTLLSRPLDQASVVRQARAFALAADKCLEDVQKGKFRRRIGRAKNTGKHVNSSEAINRDDLCVSEDLLDDYDDVDDLHEGSSRSSLKIKWESLRSYSLDLVDGPVLNLNFWPATSEQSQGQTTRKQATQKNRRLPTREKMLLWMERIKAGVDVIKMTYGPEWMFIWLLNEYGRAVNARIHISALFSKHAKTMSDTVPVQHREGHTYNEPTTQPIPLLTIRDNLLRDKEGIFGQHGTYHLMQRASKSDLDGPRARAYSAPEVKSNLSSSESEDESAHKALPSYVAPFSMEQDLARPRYELSPSLVRRKHARREVGDSMHSRQMTHTGSLEDETVESFNIAPPSFVEERISLLEHILRQQDLDGNGLSQAVTTELMIIIWMMLDVGNAWTAMALNLLGLDRDACNVVQEELDNLEELHGHDKLFTPAVLDKMQYLDSLICEAIRLCPPFLGGLKTTTETVEFPDEQLQLGKGSRVFFCQATDVNFNIYHSVGKRPENLGKNYPSVDL